MDEQTEYRKSLLIKAKKLLELANHKTSNEHEALLAMSRVAGIMTKYSLTLQDIEGVSLDATDMKREGVGETRNSKWVWKLAWAAADLCMTLPGRFWDKNFEKREIQFAGFSGAVDASNSMHSYLINAVEKLAAAYGDACHPRYSLRQQRSDFKLGMAIRIKDRACYLSEKREKELAATSSGKNLVITLENQIKTAFSIKYSKARTTYYTDEEAYFAGKREGESVGLDTQIRRRGDTVRTLQAQGAA